LLEPLSPFERGLHPEVRGTRQNASCDGQDALHVYFIDLLVVPLLWLTIMTPAFAQPPKTGSQDVPPLVAFVNVNVIPMDRERIEQRQTVIVRGDRIAAIGAADDIPVPEGATVIERAGGYLLPGLTDAHVHLPGTVFARSRPDFGDGVLYLALGVTSVMNLGGTAKPRMETPG
jgi:hypothetical protein